MVVPMTGAAKTVFPAASMPDRDWWAALWPDPGGIVQQLGIEPDMTVLDLCCGDGYFTAPLAKRVSGKVYALDFDPAMIDQARAEVVRQGHRFCSGFAQTRGSSQTCFPSRSTMS
ncbi:MULTISPECIES: class I SAM-dependent methyltransferase [unclassified Rhizobium]|uniref:class I SAM-dependent methyltransferase n=1 Tax=unclassified Rhizobium TaxID=2613769 RepID=UPI0038066E7F